MESNKHIIINTKLRSYNSYHANVFVLKMMSSYFILVLHKIYLYAFQTTLIMEANTLNPDQTAPLGAV